MSRLDHHASRGSRRVAPAHVALVAIILVGGCVQPEARGGMSASATPTDVGATATQVPSLAPAPRNVLADRVIDTRASVRQPRATADAVWAGVPDAVLRPDPETVQIGDCIPSAVRHEFFILGNHVAPAVTASGLAWIALEDGGIVRIAVEDLAAA